MRILLEGDSLERYLAKCHEALRTGLRRCFAVHCFGEGYEGFDPSVHSYRELVKRFYPSGAPELLYVFFEIVPSCPQRFRFSDLSEVPVPKAFFVGDYWNITEHYKREFIDLVEREGISLIYSYFPGMKAEFAGTSIESRIAFLPPCFDPQTFTDWGEEKRFDVGFLAAGTTEYCSNYPERYAIHQTLLAEPNLKYLWGAHPGWGEHTEEHPFVGENFSRAINSCKMFVTTAGARRHPNPKYFEILASRALLLAERPDRAEELGLKHGENYVEITPETVVDTVRYYLEHPGECERICRAGYELALKRHSCYARALDFYEAFLERHGDCSAQPREESRFSAPVASLSKNLFAAVQSPPLTTPAHLERTMDAAMTLLGVPSALLFDDNRPEPIELPSTLPELFISSAPQYSLYRLIRYLKPRSILEIGTQHGASAVAMAFAQRDNGMPVDITCIDPFMPTGDNDGFPTLESCFKNMSRSGYLGNGIQLLVTTSEKVLPYTKRQFDFIVIDGSHHYHDVKYDFLNALPLSPLGGYLWLHDYVIYESVRNACNETVVQFQLPFGVNDLQRNSRGDLCGWALVRNLPVHHLGITEQKEGQPTVS